MKIYKDIVTGKFNEKTSRFILVLIFVEFLLSGNEESKDLSNS